MKTYTIGEIYRLGLLKNYKGEPYTNKGTISKILSHLPHATKRTPFGESKLFTQAQIDILNKKNNYK